MGWGMHAIAFSMESQSQLTQLGTGIQTNLQSLAAECQRALAVQPSHPAALIGMALVALASRQTEAAVRMAEAAATAAPGLGATWVVLGQAYKTASRTEAAEAAYCAALRLDGMNALAHMGLAELRLAMGQPEAALAEYDLALRRQPAMAAAHVGMGHALACTGRNQEALEHYELALHFAPRTAEAEFAAGFVLARMGHAQQAEAHYRKAIVLRPDFAAAWMNLGCVLRESPTAADEYAEAALRRAVDLRPDMITGWLNLALLAREHGKMDEAKAHLETALELDAERVETLIAWSQFCAAQQDLPVAWMWLRKAQAHKPRHAETANMEGILLHAERRFEEAAEAFLRAETLGHRAAASNRGNSLMDMGRAQEALEAQERAVANDAQSAGARYNLALLRLRTGDWERGWQEYEARWRFREVHRRPMMFDVPRWRGERVAGKPVLLHAEQGLGDAIQFSRYADMAAARGASVVLQVHAPLERLMRSLAVVRAGNAVVARLGEKPPAFDAECPLMSLPAVFGTRPETTPWTGAYLAAEPELVAGQLRRFPRNDARLRVGLAWAGNPRYRGDAYRSMHLEMLLPLLRTEHVHWLSLQKGERAAELHALPGDVRVEDGCSTDMGLADTAALMATLDLVITTDTCIAHLAGAMAKPVWILLGQPADWRWMLEGETTPWYPTARLLRQRASGNWAEVVERASKELKQII